MPISAGRDHLMVAKYVGRDLIDRRLDRQKIADPQKKSALWALIVAVFVLTEQG